MSNKSIKQWFTSKLDEISRRPYKPKFAVGDIILNKKYQVVRKVIEVDNETYTLLDLNNPYKETANLKFKAFKDCKKLDAYYEKIDERAAKVLFGVANVETKNNDNSTTSYRRYSGESE